MTTSIKVDDSTKNQIERLRAQILLSTGQKITQQQLVGLLAGWGVENLETIKQILLDKPIALHDEEIKAYRKLRKVTGIATSPSEIDEILYGE
ncbi:MAG: hypothetical protein ACE5OZ_23375 [Candidatus Heimdallarchaeota archaeon]